MKKEKDLERKHCSVGWDMSNVGVYHYLEIRSEATASAGFNSVWNYIAVFCVNADGVRRYR